MGIHAGQTLKESDFEDVSSGAPEKIVVTDDEGKIDPSFIKAIAARLTNSGNLTANLLTWDTEDFDPSGMHNTGAETPSIYDQTNASGEWYIDDTGADGYPRRMAQAFTPAQNSILTKIEFQPRYIGGTSSGDLIKWEIRDALDGTLIDTTSNYTTNNSSYAVVSLNFNGAVLQAGVTYYLHAIHSGDRIGLRANSGGSGAWQYNGSAWVAASNNPYARLYTSPAAAIVIPTGGAGKYLIEASARVQNTGSDGLLEIRVNGTVVAAVGVAVASGAGAAISTIYDLDEGDMVTITKTFSQVNTGSHFGVIKLA